LEAPRFAAVVFLPLSQPDIAGAALFLSASISRQITGRTVVVDGGMDAKFPYP